MQPRTRHPASLRGTRNLTASSAKSESSLVTSKGIQAAYWTVVFAFVCVGIWEVDIISTETLLAYYLILAACLMPAGFWVYQKSHGMPIYPGFCAFQFLAFGTPLVAHHPGVFLYSGTAHLQAALPIAVSLCVGTFIWLSVTGKTPAPSPLYLKINLEGGDSLLLSFMFLSLFFNINLPFQWIYIPWKYLSLLQPFCNGLSTLAAFILAYRIGTGKAPKRIHFFFITCLILNTIIMNTGLFLFLALPSLALALVGYALGKHKIPWISAVIVVGITYFLHAGKNEMRIRHWDKEKNNTSVTDFTDVYHFYEEWTEVSLYELQKPKDDESSASLLERNSLLHLTLFMQDRFNAGLDTLNGGTYTIIPELLVPRILNPDKLWSLEGTTRINIHFGLQAREDTLTTTIGWGLLNEGYANFGIWGMLLVCSLMGVFLGLVGSYSAGYSIFSSRTLMAIMVLSVTIQTENTAGVFVTTLFQTGVALGLFSWIFMKKLPHEEEFFFIQTSSKNKKPDRPPTASA